MRTIWKYQIPIQDEFTLKMPGVPTLLDVQMQRVYHHDVAPGEVPILWAIVDPDAPPKEWKFRIFGTGHEISDEVYSFWKHVATFQQGPLVWHLFEER